MMTDVLIVGRGPSIRGFHDWSSYGDIMAVSSGIFVVPPEHRPPRHFVSMDTPKWFLHPLCEPDVTYAWQYDQVQQWPFWSDQRIEKHVPSDRAGNGRFRGLPAGIWEAIPESARGAFQEALIENLHMFSMQPGWGDYPNVRGWAFKPDTEPGFDGGPIGMNIGDIYIRNSWFMAIQVAQRLAYKRCFFIGCDFLEPRFALIKEAAQLCFRKAHLCGMEWVCLSEESVLNEIIREPIHAA